MEKVALVTGGGSGIGRHSAFALARDGFNVVLAGRRREALEETAANAPDGPPMLPVPTDVCDPASVEQLFQTVADQYGRLDVLFNNAGVNIPPTPLDEVTFDEWNWVITTNLTGAFLCAREAIKLMKSQRPKGGRIINNGSISAIAPRPLSAAYTASKHAITGLTKSLSLDGRGDNIVCGQIDIGNALTEMSEKSAQGTLQANGTMAAEPMMDVAHAASAVAYMASLPLEANVQFMTVMASTMPLVGRG